MNNFFTFLPDLPPEVFTLVLEELEELFGGGDGNVKANMNTGSFRCDKPAFLISLLREIPELIERTDDTVEGLRRSHFSGGQVGSRGRASMAKRAAKVRENCRGASGFVEAASVNSLTAIDGHDRQYFYELRARVVSP